MAIIKKHLREFVENNIRSLDFVKTQLESVFGTLYRVGGEERVYDIDETTQKGAIYVIGDTVHAIALAWSASRVQSIYYWAFFNPNSAPDYAIDIPNQGDISEMLPTIAYMIKSQIMGEVDIDA